MFSIMLDGIVARVRNFSLTSVVTIVLLSLCISGCSSIEEKPVGIGYDMDELKKSVCPCGKVFYRNGGLVP